MFMLAYYLLGGVWYFVLFCSNESTATDISVLLILFLANTEDAVAAAWRN